MISSSVIPLKVSALLFTVYNTKTHLSTINNKIAKNIDNLLSVVYNCVYKGVFEKMNNKLGEFIKERRLAMGMSLREFGRICGVSHTHIDSIEKGYDVRSGRTVNLTGSTIGKLAGALGIEEAELMNMYLGRKSEERAASDSELKFALFGDCDVSDEMLGEVKKFAEFIKSREQRNG